MKRSVAIAVASFDLLAGVAQRLEELDFHRGWATELRSRDAVVRAVHLAHHTTTLQVGTGIAYAFTRHPLALAASAVEGAAAANGRMTIGVGTGTAHTRGEFGIEFDHPAPRLSEYVGLMRAAIEAEGDLHFEGRFYSARMPGFAFSESREVRESVKIYGSALQPIALKALSKTCDGLALHPFGHVATYLDEVVLPSIDAGSAAVGKQRPTLASWMIACALDDGERARDLARAQIALYSAQPAFAGYFEHTPWASLAEDIRNSVDLAQGGVQWFEIGRLRIPDEMLDGLAAAGTPTRVAELIAQKEFQLESQGVDELTLQLPGIALPPAETAAALDGLAVAASPASKSL